MTGPEKQEYGVSSTALNQICYVCKGRGTPLGFFGEEQTASRAAILIFGTVQLIEAFSNFF